MPFSRLVQRSVWLRAAAAGCLVALLVSGPGVAQVSVWGDAPISPVSDARLAAELEAGRAFHQHCGMQVLIALEPRALPPARLRSEIELDCRTLEIVTVQHLHRLCLRTSRGCSPRYFEDVQARFALDRTILSELPSSALAPKPAMGTTDIR